MIGNLGGMEIGLILILILVVIGPERLPGYAAQIGRLIRELRAMAKGATTQLKAEMGDDFEELRQFDPRQYDPRRIIREALSDEPPAAVQRSAAMASGAAGAAGGRGSRRSGHDDPGTRGTTARHGEDFAFRHAQATAQVADSRDVPFDDEAT